MPLRAIQPNGEAFYAFDVDDAVWMQVRNTLRLNRDGWRLPCCDSKVVAKTSRLGTRFFAHHTRGDCAWEGETEHHLRLKSLAVAVARRHGWDASTEVIGITPDGRAWTADVLATRGRARVAVEIQWSPQTDHDLLERQRRYSKAGVRALWLIRAAGFPISEQLPAVVVRECGRGQYEVAIPLVKGASLRHNDDWAYRGVPAETLLDAAFTGRLRWGVKIGESISWTVEAATTKCWKCGGVTTPVVSIVVETSGMKTDLSIGDFSKNVDLLREVLPMEIRHKNRVGQIRARFSKTEGGSYLSNGCFECDALLGRHYQHQYLNDATVRHGGNSIVDESWMSVLAPQIHWHWRLLHVEQFQGIAQRVGAGLDCADDASV